jgi:hypothetical protein
MLKGLFISLEMAATFQDYIPVDLKITVGATIC